MLHLSEGVVKYVSASSQLYNTTGMLVHTHLARGLSRLLSPAVAALVPGNVGGLVLVAIRGHVERPEIQYIGEHSL